MRLNDDQLAELIAEIEHQKLQAQTDFKFAVVQIEQQLRDTHEIEVIIKEKIKIIFFFVTCCQR